MSGQEAEQILSQLGFCLRKGFCVGLPAAGDGIGAGPSATSFQIDQAAGTRTDPCTSPNNAHILFVVQRVA